MNHRLLTPAIVLVSFGAALMLTATHVGPWRAAAANVQAVAAKSPSSRLQSQVADFPVTLKVAERPPPAAPTTASMAATPVVTPAAGPAPEDDTPPVVTLEAQAQESESFLDARSRAAERGARSH